MRLDSDPRDGGLTLFHELEGWASRPTFQLQRWVEENLSDNGRPLEVPDVALFVSVGVV